MSLSAPNRWAVLGLVCVAQFMVILDATIVNVSLPTIEHAPPLLAHGPAVDRQRLHPRLRRVPAARRPRSRPVRHAAALHRRARHLHRRLARERRRDLVRHARRRPRPPGPRRRARLAGGARDRHAHVLGRRRAHEGTRSLERHRGGRRRRRPAARRRAHRDALVALGLLHQPADRHRRRPARAAHDHERGRRGEAGDERRRRRGHRDERPARARLRDRQGRLVRLGLRQDDRPLPRGRSRCSSRSS